MEITIRTTHPPRCLSPNAKRPMLPWARQKFERYRMAEKKRVKNDAYLLTLAELGEGKSFTPKAYTVTWYYAGIKPDADNVLGWCKSLLDGCAAAFKVNDKDLECLRVCRVHTLDKRGRNELTITFTDEEGGAA